MLKTYRYNIVLTLRSPVMSQSMLGNNLGIDTSTWEIKQKDGNNYPALPGSLIRGNLLHSWKTLSSLSNESWMSQQEINHFLGQEADTDSNKPNRSIIRTSEAWIAKQASNPQKIHRIHIDRSTGAVEDGMLQTLRVAHPVGKEIQYEGWMEATLKEDESEVLQQKIKKGLEYISSLGAFKGIGFGELLKVNIQHELLSPVYKEINVDTESIGLELTLDRPFCFAKPHPLDSNRFESLPYIPGGAIKGAIANRIVQLGDNEENTLLKESLHLIRFTHAHPASKNGNSKKRFAPIPLSLYLSKAQQGKDPKTLCFDAATETKEQTIKKPMIRFQSDWKESDWESVQPIFTSNDTQPNHTLRVRTAIEQGSEAAKDEALFAIESVNTDQHTWIGNIHISGINRDKQEAISQALQKLLSEGLNSLGKTNAQTTQIDLQQKSFNSVVPQKASIENDKLHLVLQSDALLVTAEGANDNLKLAYTKVWEKLSDSNLKLTNFFATQTLYGGDYYWRRFCTKGTPYNPLLLTQAGSVFIFEIMDKNKAEEHIKKWQQEGLPQLDGGNDWQTNPLLAENGYGEILINPQIAPIIQNIKGDG